MRLFAAEWMKTKRTPIRWLAWLPPLIFAALFTWYVSRQTITIDRQISIFQAFFEVWTAVVIPFGIGVVSGIMIHQEELAGSFGGLLGSKRPRRDLYMGKFAVLLLVTLASTMLATILFVAGLAGIAAIHISWPIFIAAALLAMAGTLPLLAFHLWISFAKGMGASIGIGGVGVLIAALMATNLGNTIWQFVPWAWPVRLTGLAGAYLPGIKIPSQMIASGFVINQGMKGLVLAAICFVLLLVGGLAWFNTWEGRK
ncbi:lantibiotic immunity ABC transporter MutG family permease subunit [Fodinisporobacter ferrooxydans]|uniref:Lantibiotic immunity ABC transporter MutG family permease subunit n=1 Tax=Fodinisporobacter ferrooxydans TaxID=2901836 RepID=A0ABY4CL78_9BACL|nr:lantibiotic immunity ABC transporter MutG family permease subunit [Alicyclobacillaceae bacterium MYW30-H2]